MSSDSSPPSKSSDEDRVLDEATPPNLELVLRPPELEELLVAGTEAVAVIVAAAALLDEEAAPDLGERSARADAEPADADA